MVGLATCATIIASQALISGCFSLVAQAINLGLMPRLKVTHTSANESGQIYISTVNWILLAGSVSLALIFKSSSNLAAAYGFAVTGVMLVTSLGMSFIGSKIGWSDTKAKTVFGIFGLIDLVLVSSNSAKFFDGAMLPVFIGVIVFIIMTTWIWGNKVIASNAKIIALADFQWLQKTKVSFSNGGKNLIVGSSWEIVDENSKVPLSLMQKFNDNGTLPKEVAFFHVNLLQVPYADTTTEKLEVDSFVYLKINVGYMESSRKVSEIIMQNFPEHLIVFAQERIILSDNANIFVKIKFCVFDWARKNSLTKPQFFGFQKNTNLRNEQIPVIFK